MARIVTPGIAGGKYKFTEGKGNFEKKDPSCIGKDGEPKAPEHRKAALNAVRKAEQEGAINDPIRTGEEHEVIGKLKPKSKEFVEAFNRILKSDFIKSIDQDPFQVMGASPGEGWRKVNADILIIHGDVLRSTDGKQLAITEWSDDDAGTLIFEISPKIPDKEIPALLRAYYDYAFEYAPITRHEEQETISDGVTIQPREMKAAELKEDGTIIRKTTGHTYRVSFKHIQVWDIFNTREDAIKHIKNAIPRIKAAAKRVLNQEYKDFESEKEADEFFKDKSRKVIDYIPYRIRNPYHPDRWMYYEGIYGIFGINSNHGREHTVDKWVEFWSKVKG